MKKTLIAFAGALFLLGATPALSQSIDTTNLTESQRVELQRQAAEMRVTKASPEETVKKVNKWAEIGSAIGTGLAAAARETGQVVN